MRNSRGLVCLLTDVVFNSIFEVASTASSLSNFINFESVRFNGSRVLFMLYSLELLLLQANALK